MTRLGVVFVLAATALGAGGSIASAQSQYDDPYVEVCFSEDIHRRICALTQQIVDEPLAIVVNCRTVLKPIVRKPLCTSSSCINISVSDLADADTLA